MQEGASTTFLVEDGCLAALRHERSRHEREVAALRASHAAELARLHAALQAARQHASWLQEEAQRAASPTPLLTAASIPISSPQTSLPAPLATWPLGISHSTGGREERAAEPKRPRDGARRLQQQQQADAATEKSCSQTELSSVLRVASSSDQLQSVVLGLMVTNARCAGCA
jgi:hypothetical protein